MPRTPLIPSFAAGWGADAGAGALPRPPPWACPTHVRFGRAEASNARASGDGGDGGDGASSSLVSAASSIPPSAVSVHGDRLSSAGFRSGGGGRSPWAPSAMSIASCVRLVAGARPLARRVGRGGALGVLPHGYGGFGPASPSDGSLDARAHGASGGSHAAGPASRWCGPSRGGSVRSGPCPFAILAAGFIAQGHRRPASGGTCNSSPRRSSTAAGWRGARSRRLRAQQ